MYVYGYIHTLSVLTHVYSSAYIYLSVCFLQGWQKPNTRPGPCSTAHGLTESSLLRGALQDLLEEGV